MGRGSEISPVIAGVVIVLVLAVAGYFIWRATGPRKGLDTSQQQQMMEMMQKQGLKRGAPSGLGGRSSAAQTGR